MAAGCPDCCPCDDDAVLLLTEDGDVLTTENDVPLEV